MDNAAREPNPIVHARFAGETQAMNGDPYYFLGPKVKGLARSVVKVVQHGNVVGGRVQVPNRACPNAFFFEARRSSRRGTCDIQRRFSRGLWRACDLVQHVRCGSCRLAVPRRPYFSPIDCRGSLLALEV